MKKSFRLTRNKAVFVIPLLWIIAIVEVLPYAILVVAVSFNLSVLSNYVKLKYIIYIVLEEGLLFEGRSNSLFFAFSSFFKGHPDETFVCTATSRDVWSIYSFIVYVMVPLLIMGINFTLVVKTLVTSIRASRELQGDGDGWYV